MIINQLRQIREKLLLSKAELASKAGISPQTISNIEKGLGCRMVTKRKIIKALDLKLSDKPTVFPKD
jgi:DNA-binding XRE family transcriptional regulator